MTGAAEFLQLCEAQFHPVAFGGVESFAAPWQERFHALDAAEREFWLDVIEATAETIEGVGQSDHFLYVGRRLT